MLKRGDTLSQDVSMAPEHARVELTPRKTILRRLGLLVPLALLLLYFADWSRQVEALGGLDATVLRTDLVSTFTGALMIHEGDGQRLYDLQAQSIAQNILLAPVHITVDVRTMLPYNHLPFEALLLAPLIGLPYIAIYGIWTLLMLFALAASLIIMQRTLPVPGYALVLTLLALVTYQPLFRCLELGQNSPLVLLGLCGTFAALKARREPLAGAACVLVALKPQVVPVVLLLLVLERKWRALAAFGGLLALLSLAVMPLLGADWPMSYAKLLLGVANWGETGAIDPAIMHNWRGFATDLLGWWAPGLVTPAYVLLALGSVGLLLWAYMHSRDTGSTLGNAPKQANGGRLLDRRHDLLWAASGLLALLAAPHLNPHDLTLLIFPAWIVAAYTLSGAWQARAAGVWLILLWSAYALIPLMLFTGFSSIYPGLVVIPNVLLMFCAAVMLARESSRHQIPPA